MNVSIITGGAGGMGLATARIIARDQRDAHIVLADLRADRLEQASHSLRDEGVRCDTVRCDVTDRASVREMIAFGRARGSLRAVIHSAGISPQMGSPEAILRINAVGTIHVTEACLSVAEQGFALVNVASMAAYMVPSWLMPTPVFALAFRDVEAFERRASWLLKPLPKGIAQTGMAYSMSKHFVLWYSRKNAARFGAKGARIVSVSPGLFETEMGKLEVKSGALDTLKTAAIARFGRPEEIAEVLAFCASDKASYLTGTDVLCDGGVVAGRG